MARLPTMVFSPESVYRDVKLQAASRGQTVQQFIQSLFCTDRPIDVSILRLGVRDVGELDVDVHRVEGGEE